MSEADIKILNDYLDENDGKLVSKKRFKFLQAIENLVNKHKEQEKMIELMAFELATEDENYLYRSIDDIIDCFEKKAKGGCYEK